LFFVYIDKKADHVRIIGTKLYLWLWNNLANDWQYFVR